MQNYSNFLSEVLITEDQLSARIKELGAEISRDYAGKELLVICILRGGVMFMTDLVRQISVRWRLNLWQSRLMGREPGVPPERCGLRWI
jgi:hypoxanthine-guanine phosphoribosyltransferase